MPELPLLEDWFAAPLERPSPMMRILGHPTRQTHEPLPGLCCFCSSSRSLRSSFGWSPSDCRARITPPSLAFCEASVPVESSHRNASSYRVCAADVLVRRLQHSRKGAELAPFASYFALWS